MDHFENPRNCGEIREVNGIGHAGKPEMGITTKISVRIEKGVIKGIAFKTAGCAASIASASMVTELVKGVYMEDAFLLSPADVSHALGGMPQEKMYCIKLAVDALRNALTDYCVRSIQGSMNQTCECCK